MPAETMRGRLIDIAAGPLADARVEIFPDPLRWQARSQGAVAPRPVAVTATGPDGVFDVDLIVPARYRFRVFPADANGAPLPDFASNVPAPWIGYADLPAGALLFDGLPLVFNGEPIMFTPS